MISTSARMLAPTFQPGAETRDDRANIDQFVGTYSGMFESKVSEYKNKPNAYGTMVDITKKWTGRQRDWSVIHAQLSIYFAERMPEYHRRILTSRVKAASSPASPPLTSVSVGVMVEKRRHRSDRYRLIPVSAVYTRGERLHKIRDRPTPSPITHRWCGCASCGRFFFTLIVPTLFPFWFLPTQRPESDRH